MASYTPLPTRTWHDNAEPYLNATNLNEIESELQTLDERTRDLKATKLEAGDVSAERLAHLEQLVDTKVSKSGDTMTGDLVMNAGTSIKHTYDAEGNANEVLFSGNILSIKGSDSESALEVYSGGVDIESEAGVSITTAVNSVKIGLSDDSSKVEVTAESYQGEDAKIDIKSNNINLDASNNSAEYAGRVKIHGDHSVSITSTDNADIEAMHDLSISCGDESADELTLENVNGKTFIKGKSIEAYTHDTDSDHISSLKADYKGFDVDIDDGDYNRKMSFRDGKLTIVSDTDEEGSISIYNDGSESFFAAPVDSELTLLAGDGTGSINFKGSDAYLIRGDAAVFKIATESYVDGVASEKMGRVNLKYNDTGMSDDLLVLIKAAMASPKYDGLATVIATNNAGHRPSWFTGWVSCVVMGTTSEKKVIAYDTWNSSRVAMASVRPNDADIDWVEVITSDSNKEVDIVTVSSGRSLYKNYARVNPTSVDIYIELFSNWQQFGANTWHTIGTIADGYRPSARIAITPEVLSSDNMMPYNYGCACCTADTDGTIQVSFNQNFDTNKFCYLHINYLR